jgi:hypothetical protein
MPSSILDVSPTKSSLKTNKIEGVWKAYTNVHRPREWPRFAILWLFNRHRPASTWSIEDFAWI